MECLIISGMMWLFVPYSVSEYGTPDRYINVQNIVTVHQTNEQWVEIRTNDSFRGGNTMIPTVSDNVMRVLSECEVG